MAPQYLSGKGAVVETSPRTLVVPSAAAGGAEDVSVRLWTLVSNN